MMRLLVLPAAFVFMWGISPTAAVEDPYEIGSPSINFTEVTPTRFSGRLSNNTEIYREWIEGTDFWEHHFSPAYAGDDPSEFWDRADKQAPTPTTVIHSLWNNPVHLIWDTPVNMGLTLKSNYIDTFSQSETGWEIAQDMALGLPNTAMVGINGMYDSGTNFYTDVWSPIIGGIFIWPPRLLTGLLKGSAPDFYRVVDVIPKTLWSIALPVRKVGISVGEEVQKVTNFGYRTITHPFGVSDHWNRYWGAPWPDDYRPEIYVPSQPRSSTSPFPRGQNSPAAPGELRRPIGTVR